MKPPSKKYFYEPDTDRLTQPSLDAFLEVVSHNDILLRRLNEDKSAKSKSPDMFDADGRSLIIKQHPGSLENDG